MALAKFLFKSIAPETQKNIFTETPIEDIRKIPQRGDIILKGGKAKAGWLTKRDDNFKEYIKAYFSPWHKSTIKKYKDELLKAFNTEKPRYAENFSILPKSWYNELLANANFELLGKLQQKAMVINNTSLRSMPTNKPAYYDPRKAGEGYPFDTLQGNLLHIGEPLLISHFTRDGVFAVIETNAQSYGFVQVQDIALVDDKTASKLLKQKYGMVIKENLNLYEHKKTLATPEFIQTVYFSTLLAVSQGKGKSLTIHLPVKDESGFMKLKAIEVSQDDVIADPLVLEESNAAKVINILIDRPYGWGGYLMYRDCAQILQDYFAVFGIHIPIFSGNQINTGKYISLADMDSKQKLTKIKNAAKPLKTILYRKGHVTLYLGEFEGRPLMFHAVWGVHLFDKNNTEYRHIIGKSAITTLEYGKELAGFDSSQSSFLSLLSAMTIVE